MGVGGGGVGRRVYLTMSVVVLYTETIKLWAIVLCGPVFSAITNCSSFLFCFVAFRVC